MDTDVLDWARRIPVDQIPSVLVFLAGRLLSDGRIDHESEHNGVSTPESVKLLTAGELAELLNLPESWIRSEERMGRIPSVRAGKYVRFKLVDVQQALTERRRQRV